MINIKAKIVELANKGHKKIACKFVKIKKYIYIYKTGCEHFSNEKRERKREGGRCCIKMWIRTKLGKGVKKRKN